MKNAGSAYIFPASFFNTRKKNLNIRNSFWTLLALNFIANAPVLWAAGCLDGATGDSGTTCCLGTLCAGAPNKLPNVYPAAALSALMSASDSNPPDQVTMTLEVFDGNGLGVDTGNGSGSASASWTIPSPGVSRYSAIVTEFSAGAQVARFRMDPLGGTQSTDGNYILGAPTPSMTGTVPTGFVKVTSLGAGTYQATDDHAVDNNTTLWAIWTKDAAFPASTTCSDAGWQSVSPIPSLTFGAAEIAATTFGMATPNGAGGNFFFNLCAKWADAPAGTNAGKSVSYNFKLDNLAPSITGIPTFPNKWYNAMPADAKFTVSGTGSTIPGGITTTMNWVRFDGTSDAGPTIVAAPGVNNYTISAGNLPNVTSVSFPTHDGFYQLSITAADEAGNSATQTTSASNFMQYDTISPVICERVLKTSDQSNVGQKCSDGTGSILASYTYPVDVWLYAYDPDAGGSSCLASASGMPTGSGGLSVTPLTVGGVSQSAIVTNTPSGICAVAIKYLNLGPSDSNCPTVGGCTYSFVPKATDVAGNSFNGTNGWTTAPNINIKLPSYAPGTLSCVPTATNPTLGITCTWAMAAGNVAPTGAAPGFILKDGAGTTYKAAADVLTLPIVFLEANHDAKMTIIGCDNITGSPNSWSCSGTTQPDPAVKTVATSPLDTWTNAAFPSGTSEVSLPTAVATPSGGKFNATLQWNNKANSASTKYIVNFDILSGPLLGKTVWGSATAGGPCVGCEPFTSNSGDTKTFPLTANTKFDLVVGAFDGANNFYGPGLPSSAFWTPPIAPSGLTVPIGGFVSGSLTVNISAATGSGPKYYVKLTGAAVTPTSPSATLGQTLTSVPSGTLVHLTACTLSEDAVPAHDACMPTPVDFTTPFDVPTVKAGPASTDNTYHLTVTVPKGSPKCAIVTANLIDNTYPIVGNDVAATPVTANTLYTITSVIVGIDCAASDLTKSPAWTGSIPIYTLADAPTAVSVQSVTKFSITANIDSTTGGPNFYIQSGSINSGLGGSPSLVQTIFVPTAGQNYPLQACTRNADPLATLIKCVSATNLATTQFGDGIVKPVSNTIDPVDIKINVLQGANNGSAPNTAILTFNCFDAAGVSQPQGTTVTLPPTQAVYSVPVSGNKCSNFFAQIGDTGAIWANYAAPGTMSSPAFPDTTNSSAFTAVELPSLSGTVTTLVSPLVGLSVQGFNFGNNVGGSGANSTKFYIQASKTPDFSPPATGGAAVAGHSALIHTTDAGPYQITGLQTGTPYWLRACAFHMVNTYNDTPGSLDGCSPIDPTSYSTQFTAPTISWLSDTANIGSSHFNIQVTPAGFGTAASETPRFVQINYTHPTLGVRTTGPIGFDATVSRTVTVDLTALVPNANIDYTQITAQVGGTSIASDLNWSPKSNSVTAWTTTVVPPGTLPTITQTAAQSVSATMPAIPANISAAGVSITSYTVQAATTTNASIPDFSLSESKESNQIPPGLALLTNLSKGRAYEFRIRAVSAKLDPAFDAFGDWTTTLFVTKYPDPVSVQIDHAVGNTTDSTFRIVVQPGSGAAIPTVVHSTFSYYFDGVLTTDYSVDLLQPVAGSPNKFFADVSPLASGSHSNTRFFNVAVQVGDDTSPGGVPNDHGFDVNFLDWSQYKPNWSDFVPATADGSPIRIGNLPEPGYTRPTAPFQGPSVLPTDLQITTYSITTKMKQDPSNPVFANNNLLKSTTYFLEVGSFDPTTGCNFGNPLPPQVPVYATQGFGNSTGTVLGLKAGQQYCLQTHVTSIFDPSYDATTQAVGSVRTLFAKPLGVTWADDNAFTNATVPVKTWQSSFTINVDLDQAGVPPSQANVTFNYLDPTTGAATPAPAQIIQIPASTDFTSPVPLVVTMPAAVKSGDNWATAIQVQVGTNTIPSWSDWAVSADTAITRPNAPVTAPNQPIAATPTSLTSTFIMPSNPLTPPTTYFLEVSPDGVNWNIAQSSVPLNQTTVAGGALTNAVVNGLQPSTAYFLRMHVRSNYLSPAFDNVSPVTVGPFSTSFLAPATVAVDPKASTNSSFALKISRAVGPNGQVVPQSQFMIVAFKFLDQRGLLQSATDFVDLTQDPNFAPFFANNDVANIPNPVEISVQSHAGAFIGAGLVPGPTPNTQISEILVKVGPTPDPADITWSPQTLALMPDLTTPAKAYTKPTAPGAAPALSGIYPNFGVNPSSITVPFNVGALNNPNPTAGGTPMTTYYIEVGTALDAAGNLIPLCPPGPLTGLPQACTIDELTGKALQSQSSVSSMTVAGLTPGVAYYMRFHVTSSFDNNLYAVNYDTWSATTLLPVTSRFLPPAVVKFDPLNSSLDTSTSIWLNVTLGNSQIPGFVQVTYTFTDAAGTPTPFTTQPIALPQGAGTSFAISVPVNEPNSTITNIQGSVGATDPAVNGTNDPSWSALSAVAIPPNKGFTYPSFPQAPTATPDAQTQNSLTGTFIFPNNPAGTQYWLQAFPALADGITPDMTKGTQIAASTIVTQPTDATGAGIGGSQSPPMTVLGLSIGTPYYLRVYVVSVADAYYQATNTQFETTFDTVSVLSAEVSTNIGPGVVDSVSSTTITAHWTLTPASLNASVQNVRIKAVGTTLGIATGIGPLVPANTLTPGVAFGLTASLLTSNTTYTLALQNPTAIPPDFPGSQATGMTWVAPPSTPTYSFAPSGTQLIIKMLLVNNDNNASDTLYAIQVTAPDGTTGYLDGTGIIKPAVTQQTLSQWNTGVLPAVINNATLNAVYTVNTVAYQNPLPQGFNLTPPAPSQISALLTINTPVNLPTAPNLPTLALNTAPRASATRVFWTWTQSANCPSLLLIDGDSLSPTYKQTMATVYPVPNSLDSATNFVETNLPLGTKVTRYLECQTGAGVSFSNSAAATTSGQLGSYSIDPALFTTGMPMDGTGFGVDISNGQPVIVIFSAPMDPTTLAGHITLQSGTAAAGGVQWAAPIVAQTAFDALNPKQVKLSLPAGAFQPNQLYQVTLSTKVLDADGDKPTQLSVQFYTAPDATIANTFATVDATGLVTKFDIPANTFPQGGFPVVRNSFGPTTNALTLPGLVPSQALSAAGGLVPTPTIRELIIFTSPGNVMTAINSGAQVTIEFPPLASASLQAAAASSANGVSSAPPFTQRLDVAGLAVYTIDPKTHRPVPVSGSVVDMASNQVTGRVAASGIYFVGAPAFTNLSTAYAYPVPFKPSAGHRTIKFANLAVDSTIKIYTIMGELVAQLHNDDNSDKKEWDVTNRNGDKVASGVYIYQIKNGFSEKRGKLIIIR